MRMLLLQQDKVTQLEDSLRQLDLDENDLFIQCSRLDKNPERQRILKNLETEIAAYGLYHLFLLQNLVDFSAKGTD